MTKNKNKGPVDKGFYLNPAREIKISCETAEVLIKESFETTRRMAARDNIIVTPELVATAGLEIFKLIVGLKAESYATKMLKKAVRP